MSPGALPSTSPELHGDGVLLTPWEERDLPGIVALADDEGRRFSRSLRGVDSIDDARAWVAGRSGPGRVDWAVRDPASRELVGRTGLHRIDHASATGEIGYGVHPGHRRRGVATAAVATAMRWAFAELALRRVELLHDVANLASCAVAARAGFALEGLERTALVYPDGTAADQHRHARLASDPPGPVDAAPAPLDVPVLVGDGVTLRPWSDEDAAVLVRGVGHPSAARWSPHPPPRTVEDGRRLLTRTRRRTLEGASLSWAVTESGAVVGSLTLRSINRIDLWATASYWVLPEARGRGVAPRALRLASTHAVEVLGLHRVQLQHAVGNAASCRVAEKAGFTLEGTQRGSCLLPEGFVDEHLHARVAR